VLKHFALLIYLLMLSGGATAQDRASAPKACPEREFDAALYLWGAEIYGPVGSGGGTTTDVDVKFSDILRNLNIGAMVAAAGRVDRFVGIFDGLWLELQDDQGTSTLHAGSVPIGRGEIDDTIRVGMGDLKIGYRVIEPAVGARQPVSLDVLAGGRYWYWHNDLNLDLPAPLTDREFKESNSWVDPVVGVRVIIGLTPGLQFSAIADVGGWGVGDACDHTWEAMGLLGVKLSDAWSLRLGFRQLNIQRGPDDINFRGPLIGGVYRF
jgi:hypothetical protein